MASFIQFRSADPEVKTSPPLAKRDLVQIEGMYQVLISNTPKDPKDTIKFQGYVPENFTIGLSSGWSAPFSGMSLFEASQALTNSNMNSINVNGSIAGSNKGGWLTSLINGAGGNIANNLMKFSGYNSYHKLMSAQVWDAPGYLTLELPIFLDGYEDTMEDVVLPLTQALKLSAPSEQGGLLIPPGPSPAGEVLNNVKSSLASTSNSVLGTNFSTDPLFDLRESFTVTVGNFFSMSPAIIEGVSMSTENVMDAKQGKPVSADVMISVKSYFAVTREDIDKWFGVA